MPGGFPLGLDICNCNDQGTVVASTRGTSVTGGNSAYGSFATVVAAAPFDTSWITVCVLTHGNNNTALMESAELAVGAGGSEKVIVHDLTVSAPNASCSAAYSFPLSVPAGTRISAAAYSIGATDTTYVNVLLFDASFTQMEGCAGLDSIGWASGKGKAVASGAANTKGSYAILTAATLRDYIGIIVGIDSQNANWPGGGVTESYLVDIAVGAGGSEKNIISNLAYGSPAIGSISTNVGLQSPSGFFPISIPAGTRIAARISSIVSTQTLGVTVYGVYQ